MADSKNPKDKNFKNKKKAYDPDKPLEFVINIEEREWKNIEPVETNWSDRTNLVFKPGWTNLIANKIWQQYPLECPFAMDKHRFYKRAGYPFLRIQGKCNECGATLVGKIIKEPASFPYSIDIKTFDTRGIKHTTSRQLRFDKRDELREKAKNAKPLKLRHQQANECLDDEGNLKHGTKERPDLNSTAVFSKLRHENNLLSTAEYPGDDVTELINLQLNFPDYVRSFSTVPVVVHYWSENQRLLWNEVGPLKFAISIDASGKFCHAVCVFDGEKSPPIFLYNIVFRMEGKPYTISQMLSSAHDVGEIASWLSAWIKSGASMPLEVVVDCALALLISVCMIFCHLTYVEYLNQNMNFLLGHTKILPRCNIKRDRAHLIKACYMWLCFKNDNWTKQDFYIRVIAFSLEIETLSELKEVFVALIVVCTSKVQSTQYLESFKLLEKKINTFNHKKFYDVKKDDCEKCTHENCEILKETDFSESLPDSDKDFYDCEAKKYIMGLVEEAEQLLKAEKANDSTVSNNYELPSIRTNLINLYTQFSAWTNVMHPFYDYAPRKVSTSTGSEIYYRISRRDYDFSSPKSIKKFILDQKPVIDGATKLGRMIAKPLLEKLAKKEEEERKKKEKGERNIEESKVPESSNSTTCSQDVLNVFDASSNNNNFIEEPGDQYFDNSRSIALVNTEEKQKVYSPKTDSIVVIDTVKQQTEIEAKRDMIFSIDLSECEYMIIVKDYFCRLAHLDLFKCTITVKEFQSLIVPEFVDGNIIDVLMSIKLKSEWKNVDCIPTKHTVFMVGDQWEARHGKTWSMLNINYPFKRWVFIPYCYKLHWMLIILDLLNMTATHFDPRFDPKKPKRWHDYKAAFNHYLSQCQQSNILKKDWKWVENTTKVFKQTDGYNCGPIVMHYMSNFASTGSCATVGRTQKFKPDVYRLEIAKVLLEDSDVSDDICLYCYNVNKSHFSFGWTHCKKCKRWAHNLCIIRNNTKLMGNDKICEFCQAS